VGGAGGRSVGCRVVGSIGDGVGGGVRGSVGGGMGGGVVWAVECDKASVVG
jgi:hypothetical protein